MPPKKKASAPANLVYQSSTPLQQSRFPLRSTRIKYGKQAIKKVPKQETLTQMDFVNLHRPVDENDDEEESYEEPEKPKTKRRKTVGDEPLSNSKYHTQTITQLDWSFTSEREDEEEDIFDVPSSSPQSKKRRKDNDATANPLKPSILGPSRRKSAPSSSAVPKLIVPPHTPHRRTVQEIPSSESPATPPSRASPVKGSVLSKRSINISIPFNINAKLQSSPSNLPMLRIEDTFESENVSQQSRIPTTPKRSSPVKNVRFASLEGHKDAGPVFVEEVQEKRPLAPGKSSSRLMDEILDSDAESDEDCQNQDIGTSQEDREEEETCYGEVGLETQKLLETQKRRVSTCIKESHIHGEEFAEELTNVRPRLLASQILREEMQENLERDEPQGTPQECRILAEELSADTPEEITQYMESQRLETQHVRSMAPRTKHSDAFVSIRPPDVTKIVERTKNHDFRRQFIPETVSRIWIYETSPTRTLKYMAVIGPAKGPGEIVGVDGVGNAEFNAKDPNCGDVAWEILDLYELADPLPWATIAANEWLNAPPKRPTLLRPAVIDQLMANLKPPIYCRVPDPEPLTSSATDMQEAEEQLLSTMLQYTQLPISTDIPSSQAIIGADEDNDIDDDGNIEDEDDIGDEDDDEELHPGPPDSSRRSTTPYNTIHTQVDRSNSTPQEATQGTMAPPNDRGTPLILLELPRSSQAETVDLSQTQTPRHQSVADIVFESPTRPIFPSSTPLSLPTPRERESVGPDWHVPYSISSQLLRKSQMLPESLLNDCLVGPLQFIQDSDEDDDS